MSDPRRKLANLWGPSSRFNEFGNVISKLVVSGVRCHTQTTIEFRSPITAFSGFNGTGKSTMLQLCAAAYVCQADYTINSFMRKGPLDQTVFSANASVQLEFQDQSGVKPLTLSYNPDTSRWQGYPRRPLREVFFGGVGVFLPRSEQRDFVFLNSSRLTLGEAQELPEALKQHIARILSSAYRAIHSNQVSHKSRKDTLLSANRNGSSYSEAHMGCGEGRIQCLIQRLEAMPERSLILLEEPEISLHPSAEYELGKYLLDLIDRKRHQVLLTTHSSMLLRSLPDASLVFLARHGDTITPLPGIGARQAASLLTEGHDKALTVLVEDEAAKLVLTELIRHHNPGFLATLHIAVARERRESGRIDASGKDAIRSTMKTLSEAGLKLAAVLDGGEAVDSQRYIFCLPGREPPESELFKSPSARRMIEATYNLKIEDLEAELAGADCHQIFKTIGRRTSCDEAYLIQEAARAYVHDVPAADVNRLIELLKEASQRR
jgi:predicted ATPase